MSGSGAGEHSWDDGSAATLRVGVRPEDVDAALEALNETLDIDRGDIDRLLRQVELQALARTQGDLTCGEVMSRATSSPSMSMAVPRRRGTSSSITTSGRFR